MVENGEVKCAAYGCKRASGKSGLFCDKDWRRLPEDLRGPAAAKRAVVHLAKEDGYLVEVPKSALPVISDADRGREYV